ncbi:universal stress protein [Streptomyces sp. NPDC047928]|uniref:universal stress protein n=1 Tax=unclassified Streptomyces TaxID=2593676 RepID=UPI0037111A05
MRRSVIVGVDGSAESLAAARWGADEAVRRDAPLHLVHAWRWHPHPSGAAAAGATQRYWAQLVLREAEEAVRETHPDLRVTDRQMSRTPVSALLTAALDAEVLVLGSRGLSGLTGYLVGSVAAGVVARTPCPVVLVRAGERTGPGSGGRVVLGLDLAHPCDELLAYAFDAADRRGAELRVVHAFAPGAARPYDDPERFLSAVLAPWRSKYPDVTVTETAAPGRAARHLLDAAAGASLLVAGRRARPGPIAHALVHHAHCPVAVVPHD